jgi:hypothetical protein
MYRSGADDCDSMVCHGTKPVEKSTEARQQELQKIENYKDLERSVSKGLVILYISRTNTAWHMAGGWAWVHTRDIEEDLGVAV